MKTKSSNSHEDSKKVSPSISAERMRGTANLQKRNSSDGREQSYESDLEEERESGMEWKDKIQKKSEKEITGKVNQEDIKKDFEIRSERESEKHSGANGTKREEDQHSDEEEEGKNKSEEKESSWHRSYKGDAEIVI